MASDDDSKEDVAPGLSEMPLDVEEPTDPTENGDPSSNAECPSSPPPIDPRTSFTADSPYFEAFNSNEIKSLQSLTDTLSDISNRTTTFAKTGTLMSQAMRRLAISCKLRREMTESEAEEGKEPEEILQQRKRAIGEEMGQMLEHFGDVRNQKVKS